jgi:hypothetical protein
MKPNYFLQADSRSLAQEIPHLAWNPEVHYNVSKNTALVNILSSYDFITNYYHWQYA